MTGRLTIAAPTEAPSDTVPPSLAEELKKYETRILAGEGDALRARWECGQRLLPIRVGKQFPTGFLANVAKETGTSEWELRKRVKFADRYPTEDEVGDAVTNFVTWHRIVREGLAVKREKKAAPSHPKVIGEARLTLRRWRKELASLHGYGWDDETKREFDDIKAELMRIQEEINEGTPAQAAPESKAASR